MSTNVYSDDLIRNRVFLVLASGVLSYDDIANMWNPNETREEYEAKGDE